MNHYTIKLDNGKYTIIKYPGSLEFLRHGEPWPAADDLRHAGVVRAMHDRIEELEMAINQVLYGSLREDGVRMPDGMDYRNPWAVRLRAVLEQKP